DIRSPVHQREDSRASPDQSVHEDRRPVSHARRRLGLSQRDRLIRTDTGWERTEMLFREADGHRYAVTQPTHAWVSGNLASAWGTSRFGDARPRDEVALGADLHDIGWLQWEQRPTLNADTGLPHNFMQLPTSVHLSIWGSASSLARPFGRYAALLVSMHGTGLYAFHDYSRDTEDE